ncbi:MAG: hypothetical protein ACOYM9_11085 [Bradymonadia bacterium]
MKAMKAVWMLGAALALTACGGTEGDDTGAQRVDENGSMAVTTLDLTADDGAYVVDVRGDGSIADDLVVRQVTGQRPAREWFDDVRVHLNIAEFQGGSQIVLVTGQFDRENESPESVAERARNGENAERPCPEDCLHCPEDNVFLCQAMCGGF